MIKISLLSLKISRKDLQILGIGIFFSWVLLQQNSQAAILTCQEGQSSVSEKTSLVLNAIREGMGVEEPIIPLKKEEEKKVIDKEKGENKTESKTQDGQVKVGKVDPKVDKEEEKIDRSSLGKGAEYVQKALERNREILRQRQLEQQETKKREKEEEVVAFPEDETKQKSFAQRMKEKEQGSFSRWKNKTVESQKAWKEKVEKTYSYWKEEQKKFLGRLKGYKENLIELPGEAPVSSQDLKKSLGSLNTATFKGPVTAGDAQVVSRSMDIPIRDQGKRPTCSAFAGVRAIEILLQQSGVSEDLSEQYFYWASKPQCQKNPCSIKGSWVREGFRFGQLQKTLDIPTEMTCPYKDTSQEGNETQVPLGPACFGGKVRVVKYAPVNNLEDVVEALQRHSPVIAGFRLSENFYRNEGLVTMEQATLAKAGDDHAKGHALLIIGYMPLPSAMRAKEGAICFLAANSWGEGWGRGGYACLTEAWVKNFRFPSPFMSLSAVEI